jgi:hypothetical protein
MMIPLAFEDDTRTLGVRMHDILSGVGAVQVVK